MTKVGWGTAAIYAAKSRRRDAEKPLPAPKHAKPAVRIDCASTQWLAVRVASNCERRVTDELSALGYLGYCPMGAKFAFWHGGKWQRRRVVKQFPVFARYVFVGLGAHRVLGRKTVDKIEAILGDSRGPLFVPARAVQAVNEMELAGTWDATRSWREKSPYQPGVDGTVVAGPLTGFAATVDMVHSEERIRVLVSIFGRPTRLDIDACQMALS